LRRTKLVLTPTHRAGPDRTGAAAFVDHQRPNVVAENASTSHDMPPLPPLLTITVRIDLAVRAPHIVWAAGTTFTWDWLQPRLL
jgi:hypothetical protein